MDSPNDVAVYEEERYQQQQRQRQSAIRSGGRQADRSLALRGVWDHETRQVAAEAEEVAALLGEFAHVVDTQ